MEFILTLVEPNQGFTDKSTIPGVGSRFFHHQLKKPIRKLSLNTQWNSIQKTA